MKHSHEVTGKRGRKNAFLVAGGELLKKLSHLGGHVGSETERCFMGQPTTVEP